MKHHPVNGALFRARTLRKNATDAERKLWRALSALSRDGVKFRRQVPFGPYIADFACHAAKLIVEVDGGQHDPSSDAEIARAKFLENQGYRVLRIWNHELLNNLDGVMAVILDAVGPHHPHPNPSPIKGEGL